MYSDISKVMRGLHAFLQPFKMLSCIIFSVYEIKLGTVDQNEADVEWRLRPYMNTSKKRKALSS